MEDDLLTAVTGQAVVDYPVVAPLPSISNRLSVADFQRISPTRMDYSSGNNNNSSHNTPFNLPEVAITEPALTPERFGFWSPAGQVYRAVTADFSILNNTFYSETEKHYDGMGVKGWGVGNQSKLAYL